MTGRLPLEASRALEGAVAALNQWRAFYVKKTEHDSRYMGEKPWVPYFDQLCVPESAVLSEGTTECVRAYEVDDVARALFPALGSPEGRRVLIYRNSVGSLEEVSGDKAEELIGRIRLQSAKICPQCGESMPRPCKAVPEVRINGNVTPYGLAWRCSAGHVMWLSLEPISLEDLEGAREG